MKGNGFGGENDDEWHKNKYWEACESFVKRKKNVIGGVKSWDEWWIWWRKMKKYVEFPPFDFKNLLLSFHPSILWIYYWVSTLLFYEFLLSFHPLNLIFFIIFVLLLSRIFSSKFFDTTIQLSFPSSHYNFTVICKWLRMLKRCVWEFNLNGTQYRSFSHVLLALVISHVKLGHCCWHWTWLLLMLIKEFFAWGWMRIL